MRDTRQPWIEKPEEYCWCDPCIRDREEQHAKEFLGMTVLSYRFGSCEEAEE